MEIIQSEIINPASAAEFDWRPIKGYEGYYEVSENGQIRRLIGKRCINGRIIKQNISTRGYCKAVLSKMGNKKDVLIHRIVAETFIPNPDLKKTVNHINGIKTDNRINNLEWNTPQENVTHAEKAGLRNTRGENNTNHKLKEADVVAIRTLLNTKGKTHRQIADHYGVKRSCITNIINKKIWRHI